MRSLSLAVLVFFAFSDGVYIPGNPGGSWTKDELMIVKAKLYRLYGNRILAPPAVRLGFHDCLKYADGTGGCDGCLNWHGVGVRHNPVWRAKNLTNVEVTDNNGLKRIVKQLEKIYTRTNFPWNSPTLGQSLKDSGKSRADLWAYASMVGVEYGIEMNNIACSNRNDNRVRQRSCVHDPNTEECFVRPLRPFSFQSGRADCTEFDETNTYQATTQEHHPSPLDNGRKTVEFFKDDFNFTGRETAAIFGAHTFGKPHFSVSLFPYTWTSSGINLFNNDYYKGITGQNRWFFNDNTCNPVGDAYGNRPKSRWLAHARMVTQRGGPIFWIHENLVCPNPARYESLKAHDKTCIDEAGPGMTCRADPRTSNGTDMNENRGCERYRFISGRDEIALNCEMGLYREFEVENGILHGCPGLEHFNETMTNTNNIVWSQLPGVGRAEPLCEKQRLSEPAGSAPLYEVMEEYANNQTTWITDYIHAHEKMVHNGYSQGSLTTAPDHFTNTSCPLPLLRGKNEYTFCYEIGPVTGAPFRLGSRMSENAGKVVVQRGQSLHMEDISESTNQEWQFSGNHLINVGTGLPLRIDGQVYWTGDATNNADGDYFIRDTHTGKVMDAYSTRDGHPVVTYQQHGAPWQLFYLIISS